jgi:hypothetical protein
MKKTMIIFILTAALLLTACSTTEVSTSDTQTETSQTTEIQQDTMQVKDIIKIHSDSVIVNEQGETIDSFDLPIMLNSDLIVIGEFVENARGGFTNQRCESTGNIFKVFPNSFNQLLVTDVLQGDIEVGEIITISQQYAYDEENATLKTFGCAIAPMNKGDRWIYFLAEFDNAIKYFEGINHELGMEIAKNGRIYNAGIIAESRFPVPNEELSRSAKTADTSLLGVFDRNSFNFSLYSEVLDHFQIEARDWVNPGRSCDAALIELYASQGR